MYIRAKALPVILKIALGGSSKNDQVVITQPKDKPQNIL